MSTLTTHLQRPDDHGRLPFHPECPVCCRERLAGTLPSDALVGRRAPALLAAGVLVLSTASPAAVIAAEPDTEQQGATNPCPAAEQSPEGSPDYDPDVGALDTRSDAPGSDAADAPDAPGADPAAPDADPVGDAGVPDDVAADVGAASQDSGVGSVAPDQGTQVEPPAQNAAPAPTSPPPAAPQPPTVNPAAPEPPPAQPATPAPSGNEVHARAPRKHDVERANERHRTATPPASRSADSQTQPVPVVSAPTQGAPSTSRVAQAPTRDSAATANRAKRGDRTHVVAPGESLWSIADDLLGDDASVARLAREVNRLWELNARRIGTGDPSLVHVGTTLLL
jgi:hypothetical protein